MTEKKASEVLAEISEKMNKMDEILAYVKNIDFNYKLVIAKLNEKNKISLAHNEYSLKELSSVASPIAASVITQPESISNLEVDNTSEPVKKVTVQQKITYPNDKPAVLAKVLITNEKKEKIAETKTNHGGKWATTLLPGSYFVHVTKAEVADKPKIDHYFPITIPISKTPIELDPKK